jgi:uncharacterized protein YndB with AHSA1/START domain
MTEPADNVVELGVPVEQVWDAISTVDGLTGFMADQAAVEPGLGGHVQIGWGGDMMAPAAIDAWDPPHRLLLRGNGIAEEWLLEGHGGSTTVRLVFSGYGDTDWDETYDAFDATGALVLQMLLAWLDEHRGVRPHKTYATATLPLDRAGAWSAALTGLGVENPVVGGEFGLMPAGSAVAATLRMYGDGNECLFAIPEWDGARLMMMVRSPTPDSSRITYELTCYGTTNPAAHKRLQETAQLLEKEGSR